jgi:hypothetical protein
MAERNPARSGDKKLTCWMMMSKEDFYYNEYRSLTGQMEIMEIALRARPTLAKEACDPTNRFHRNIKAYLGACYLDNFTEQDTRNLTFVTLPQVHAMQTVSGVLR